MNTRDFWHQQKFDVRRRRTRR